VTDAHLLLFVLFLFFFSSRRRHTRFSRDWSSDVCSSDLDTAMRYQDDGTPLVVLAGKDYGSGSSRDWAAKGSRLLGIRAVIAERSEERRVGKEWRCRWAGYHKRKYGRSKSRWWERLMQAR